MYSVINVGTTDRHTGKSHPPNIIKLLSPLLTFMSSSLSDEMGLMSIVASLPLTGEGGDCELGGGGAVMLEVEEDFPCSVLRKMKTVKMKKLVELFKQKKSLW